MNLPPQPSVRVPILHPVVNIARFATAPLDFVGRRFERLGATYSLLQGKGPHLVVTHDPAIFRTALVERPAHWQKAGSATDELRTVLGDGLLTADGVVWKQARRKLQPGFRAKAVATYAARMADAARAIPWSDGQSTDVAADMTAVTLSVVSASLFEEALGAEAALAIGHNMTALNDVVAAMAFPEWARFPWRRRQRKALVALDAQIDHLVSARRQAGLGDDLLSLLLQAGFDDRAVRDHLVTLYLAGHETTSNTLAWVWWLLATHPEARDRLFAEVDALPDDPGPDTAMPWVEAVIDEALRLYPPAYVVARAAACDTELGPWTIPKGTQLAVWIWHAQRRAESCENPDVFRPERFVDGPAPETFLPFGAGPRMCIGEAFARQELRLIIGIVARRWRLEMGSDHPVRPYAGVTLSPKGGLPMSVHRRTT